MHRVCLILFGLLQTQITVGAGEQADKRLADLLEPRAGAGILPSQPVVFPALKDPKIPALTPPKFPVQPPRPELAVAKQVYPHMASEPPLMFYFATPAPPLLTVMSTTALVAIPVLVDVNKPQPLPILSPTSLGDRPALGDATLEASVAASLARPLPARATPVPFVPMNLPDPFEHQQYIRLKNPPQEEGPLLTIPATILVVPLPAVVAPKK